MHRDIEEDLIRWKHQKNPMPLLLRGARQVGKTYVVENFGDSHFNHVVSINFELHPEMAQCFVSLEPADILKAILLLTGQKIEPQTTLLFLDEIQECPNAIQSLRYFKEKMPNLHIIGAGSLLEFALNDVNFRMPVGRVQSLYLKPLSFKEYLVGGGNQVLREFIENITLQETIPEVIHTRLLKLVREYMILGGMPAVLQKYFSEQDHGECQNIQTALLSTYRNDFGKYAKKTDHRYLKKLFEKLPGLICDDFKYTKVDADMRSRDIKEALYTLKNAGLIYPVYSTSASGVPLTALINEKKFKLLFLDVGLVTRAGKLEVELLLSQDLLLINRGKLAEQFVGQELLAYAPYFEESVVYFWSREQRNSMAEVDFVTTVDANIVPLEVKAGTTGRLKSLKLFMAEKNITIGVHISQNALGYSYHVLSLPLYMVGEMARLMQPLLYDVV